MKIVYISNSIIPSRTANSIHVMKMCQAFFENGHEVILFAPDRLEEYETDVDDIYKYYGVKNCFSICKLSYGNIRYIRNIKYSLAVIQELKKVKPDLVYGRDIYGCFFSSYKYHTIFELHAPMQNFIKKNILNAMCKNLFYKNTVVISDSLKKIVLETQNIRLDKLLVAHDGSDEVTNFDTKIQLLGSKYNLKVGYVGSLYQGKGVEVIASIFDKVSDNIEFHIIGGLEKDISLWKKKINSKNVFFYGFISQKDISMYINSLDICLLPNQKVVLTYGANNKMTNISEFTSPLKMFEYMAHKKPIICSNLPVLKEVLNDDNALLVDCDNIGEWINAIEKLKDYNIRIKLAERAYEDFRQKYSWKNRVKDILNAI